ncbi:ATP-dependent zinc metalloprotease FtsH [Methylomarinum sp. Ch1-1]|uniref:ATP-dependent zinc metalloprotease FtsH n=1 Tax=Methylomarinum roseum TaxID=3067653 RepID=A0AAU7NX93_9GAMM|nr:ATP-dependent zinc metalloprotease FtsH [Methylomarinum sp. Ch1-1]MDP4522327.1 ATP-dependent zinc metalloprotease FtsH [Methylomarinum sp. Ch1-1]
MKKFLLLALLIIAVGSATFFYDRSKTPATDISNLAYSSFINKVRDGQVEKVEMTGRAIQLWASNGKQFVTYSPDDPNLIEELLAKDVQIITRVPQAPSMLKDILISWAPILLLIAVWLYFMRAMQKNGGAGNLSFQKSKAKLFVEDQIKITFNDVAGCEEAKHDVIELVDFLKAPDKFRNLGGKIPRGVLMVGPPGTGKTLIARAIAGEAKVKFFSISGSDFVEMYVGVGASRVRDLFSQAKAHSPCIIFIDEIDAVGRKRSNSNMTGGNDEREQTLNQLLVEMDGFEDNDGIIVIAATNRVDVLDDALLRPGRFDRQVNVGLPDVLGREQILNVHLQKIPAADDVKVSYIARGTPGFSGAELANLVNEAALVAARADLTEVTMAHLEKAKDKIMLGAEKQTLVMSEEDKRLTAYHEAGHCIVGQLMPDHDPVYKVSIMPRGSALGMTMFLPEKDQYSASKRKLEGQIAGLFGGRLAELLIFGDDLVTTGASNDIERATGLARKMVTRWGLSDKLGPLSYAENNGLSSFQQSDSAGGSVSSNVAQIIDEEIRSVIDRNYRRAEKLLQENMDVLHRMAEALMKWETIDRAQIDDLMAGREVRPPQEFIKEQDGGDTLQAA